MSESESESRSPLTDGRIWIRLLYMILFAILFGIAEFVLYVVAIIGFVFRLFSKRANPQIAAVGHAIALYVHEIADFVSFNTETPPFPFSNWPSDSGG